jgi:hypothetical protein
LSATSTTNNRGAALGGNASFGAVLAGAASGAVVVVAAVVGAAVVVVVVGVGVVGVGVVGAGAACSESTNARPKAEAIMQRACGDWPRRDKSRQTVVVNRAFSCLALCAASAASVPARAVAPTTFDPLVPPAGLGAAGLVVDAFASRLSFDDDGVATVDDRTRALSLTARGQWSLGDGVAVTASLPWSRVTREGAAIADVTGVGDAHVGLRVARWSLPAVDVDHAHDGDDGDDGATVNPVQFGLAVDVKLPLYASSQSSTDARAAALGDGGVDVALVGEVAAALPFGGAFSWRTGTLLRGRVTDAVVGGGAFAVDVLGGRLRPAATLDFSWSLDPEKDDDGNATEVVGRGAAALGGACRVDLAALAPGLSLDVGASVLSRGRHALGGVLLSTGVSHAF